MLKLKLIASKYKICFTERHLSVENVKEAEIVKPNVELMWEDRKIISFVYVWDGVISIYIRNTLKISNSNWFEKTTTLFKNN